MGAVLAPAETSWGGVPVPQLPLASVDAPRFSRSKS